MIYYYYNKEKEKKTMEKIKCPICGKELDILNNDTRGITYNYYYVFWCDECEIDITIQTDSCI